MSEIRLRDAGLRGLAPLWRYGRAHRRYLVHGFAGTVGVVFFRLAIPWPLRGVLEFAFPTGSSRGETVLGLLPSGEPLLWLSGAYLTCAVGAGLSEMAQRIAMGRFASSTTHDVRSAALTAAASRFRGVRAMAGDLIARLVADVGRLRADLTGILVHVSKDGLLFLAVALLFLSWISPMMGAFFVVGGALAGWIGYVASRPMASAARRARSNEGAMAATIEQALEHGHLLSRGLDDPERDRDRGAKGTRILALAGLSVHAVLGLTVCSAAWVGVTEVRAGTLAPGELFLFIAYALTVHRRLVDAGRQLARIGKVRACVERLAPLLDAGDPRALALPRPLHSGIGLDRLRVVAARGKRPRLDDVSLEIRAGSRTAVLGRPAEGKSTLLRCLAGVEVAFEGDLAWDGTPLVPLDPLFATSVGYLPQDPVFSPTPVWQMLGLSRPDGISAGQIEVLRGVGAWKIIERFPKELRQKVGSGTLSRGEARALSLGAALLCDAPLLVLDSPLEGLRKGAASRRLEAILTAATERTLVVALPQLRDARAFGRVVVLRRGGVAFDGTPAEWRLWKAGGPEEVTACRA